MSAGKPTKEDVWILHQRLKGRTLQDIGRELGVTRERVRQRVEGTLRGLLHTAERYRAAKEECRLKACRIRQLELFMKVERGSVPAIPIETLELTTSVYLALKGKDLHTVPRVAELTRTELRQRCGLGQRQLVLLEYELGKWGFALQPEAMTSGRKSPPDLQPSL